MASASWQGVANALASVGAVCTAWQGVVLKDQKHAVHACVELPESAPSVGAWLEVVGMYGAVARADNVRGSDPRFQELGRL